MPLSRSGWARHPLAVRFDDLVASLERGASVELIASCEPQLVYAAPSQLLDAILDDPAFAEFDSLPVRENDKVVGVLRRGELLAARPRQGKAGVHPTVGDYMVALDESILISAETGLLTFIADADRWPCRLLIKGTRIIGIVTIADLQKLPVRPVLFVLVTYVELLILEVLRARFGGDDVWMGALNPDRRGRVENKWRKLRNGNLAIDKLTATEFGDKVDVLLRTVRFPDIPPGPARRELVWIEELRNSVTHAGDYALTPANARKTVETVRAARLWIDRLGRILRAEP